MRIQEFLGVVLATAAVALAQKYDPSPRGHLSTEGGGFAWYMGASSSSRHMFFDGELRGKAGPIKEVAFRVDYRSHTEIGRAWNKVTLNISDCDRSRLSSTFSLNPTSTPTLVFSGRAAWPTLTGFPHTRPAAFGATNGRLRFPFQGVWVYGGSTDICLDFDFDGGTLANNNTFWPAGAIRAYYLDGFDVPPSVRYGTTIQYGKHLNSGGCVSQGSYGGWGGHARLETATFGLNSTQHPGKARVSIISLGTEPNQPIIFALSLGGSAAGVTFPGITCNKLHVDLTKPHVTVTKTASAPYGLTDFTLALVTYQPVLAGLPLWLQAAWIDVGTGGMMLTNGSRNAIPAIARARLRTCVYTPIPGNKNLIGLGPFLASEYNPVCRFTR